VGGDRRFRSRSGKRGLVDLGGEILVFDTSWTPAAARELLGLGPVRWVVNSHWHGDHVRGNQVFEGATARLHTRHA
jgi:cyclase